MTKSKHPLVWDEVDENTGVGTLMVQSDDEKQVLIFSFTIPLKGEQLENLIYFCATVQEAAETRPPKEPDTIFRLAMKLYYDNAEAPPGSSYSYHRLP